MPFITHTHTLSFSFRWLNSLTENKRRQGYWTMNVLIIWIHNAQDNKTLTVYQRTSASKIFHQTSMYSCISFYSLLFLYWSGYHIRLEHLRLAQIRRINGSFFIFLSMSVYIYMAVLFFFLIFNFKPQLCRHWYVGPIAGIVINNGVISHK